MKKFKINQYYHNEKEQIYESSWVSFRPGLTVLVGCNGAGKTTLLHQIEDKCKNNDIPVLTYDNYHNGGSNAMGAKMFIGNIDGFVSDMSSSEGERISNNISDFATKLGRFVRTTIGDIAFILLDAVDSGFSVDNVIDVKNGLLYFAIDDAKSRGLDLYILVSANEYEMARDEDCFDVIGCKYLRFNDYEEYREFIIDTNKKKRKRYGWED